MAAKKPHFQPKLQFPSSGSNVALKRRKSDPSWIGLSSKLRSLLWDGPDFIKIWLDQRGPENCGCDAMTQPMWGSRLSKSKWQRHITDTLTRVLKLSLLSWKCNNASLEAVMCVARIKSESAVKRVTKGVKYMLRGKKFNVLDREFFHN